MVREREVARVFMSGRSQAVRIPKSFRFTTGEVFVVKKGDSLLLTPCRSTGWDDFFKNRTCPDFVLDRSAAQAGQQREMFG